MPLAAWHVTNGSRGVFWNAELRGAAIMEGHEVRVISHTHTHTHTHTRSPSPRSYTGASVLLSVHK